MGGLLMLGFAAPAQADCVVNGTIVICSGNTPGGFSTPDNGLSLTVTPGAAVGDTISLNDNNTVANFGTIAFPAASTYGIAAGSGNFITNSGVITSGAGTVGIGVSDFNTVVNNGTIALGDGSTGISVGNSSTVINSGLIVTGTGGFGIGIQDNSTVINNGTIAIGGGGGYAIFGGVSDNIVNNGTIRAGAGSIGIGVSGASTVTNNGTIRVGDFGFGIVAINDGNTIVNKGTIVGGLGATAILAQGNSNTVINTGTIDGAVFVGFGTGNTLVNTGLITITAPWTGVGEFHAVDGTFTQTASGTLALRVSTDTCCGFDQLLVTGRANLGGTLRAVVQPGLYRPTTVFSGALQYGSMTGAFASVQSSSVFFNALAYYYPTSFDLVLTRIPFNQVTASGANGRSIGNVLEANYSTGLTGSLATFYSNLLASSAPNTLSQLTGEVATASQNVSYAVFGQFLSTVFGQTASNRALGGAAAGPGDSRQTALRTTTTTGGGTRMSLGGGEETCSSEVCDTRPSIPRYTAWAQGFGGAGSIDGNINAGNSRLDMNSGGGATGIDLRLDKDTLLGVTMGTASAAYDLSDLMSFGTARSLIFGIYGGHSRGPAYIDGALAYGYSTFTTNRTIGTGTLGEVANASFDGYQYGGRVEGGWRFGIDRHWLTPFAGLTAQAFQQSGYTETSRNVTTGAPGMLAVSVQGQTTTSVRSTLGAQFETAILANDGNAFRPRLRLGWGHEYNVNRSATVSLSSLLPGAPFQVTGAQAAADSLVVGAGFDLELGGMVRLYGQFDGNFASNASAFAGTGGVRLLW